MTATSSNIHFHAEAQRSFQLADASTQSDAIPILALLSTGFEITWFRESSKRLWLAAAKPMSQISDHFGLRLECFVIGNGYTKDFHQRTLFQEPPAELADRLDTSVRFVASQAPLAEASCAAWAATKKVQIVMLNLQPSSSINPTADLYKTLSSSLWRRDLFAESEPVRSPSEFFGREVTVNEILAKIIAGAPIAVFGLRKIGKSSLLGRVEDLLEMDESSVSCTAFLLGNSAKLKSGRWWHAAQEMLTAWQTKLQRAASRANSKVHPKADRLNDAVGRKIVDISQLTDAFERDVLALLKASHALRKDLGRESARLVLFLDECDHLYPHLNDAGYWRSDFFVLWNTMQTIKRRLENPEELVYVFGGVNPSGVEQGSLLDQPNPLFETQRLYLTPMPRAEAGLLLGGLGKRMGLRFEEDAIDTIYKIVGGHPLLLRKFGTAIHQSDLQRSSFKAVSAATAQRVFDKNRREFYNQILWTLDHLRRVASDEERLLRDLALGGAQAYAELWSNNELRETFAYHLERYGLVYFEDDVPIVELPLFKQALQKPDANEFRDQKRLLKDVVESIESAVRARLCSDLEREKNSLEVVQAVVSAIPSDAKNRPMGRQDLLDLGEVAGLSAVLEALNWGDYEILLNKFYDTIDWIGVAVEKAPRLAMIKKIFVDAHLVRHNNDHKLFELIRTEGFSALFSRFCAVRDMLAA